MTRKHFQAIAAVLRAHADGHPEDIARTLGITCDLASVFARENPRFDRARFLAACGMPSDDERNGKDES